MTSFEGDTGPYLQYTHVRLTSLTRKNPELLPLPPPKQIATETLAEQAAAREIAFFCWARTRTLCGRRCARTSRAGWSRSRSGPRMRSRARGGRLWSRARRTSSGRVRRMWLYLCSGCVWGRDAAVEHSSVGTHVGVEWMDSELSSPLLLGADDVHCALTGTCDMARKKNKGWKRHGVIDH